MTATFTLRNGECKKVEAKVLCSFCDEPATHLVRSRDLVFPCEYDLSCLGCVANGLMDEWYPFGVSIRKRTS